MPLFSVNRAKDGSALERWSPELRQDHGIVSNIGGGNIVALLRRLALRQSAIPRENKNQIACKTQCFRGIINFTIELFMGGGSP